jgi:hypothetical protein
MPSGGLPNTSNHTQHRRIRHYYSLFVQVLSNGVLVTWKSRKSKLTRRRLLGPYDGLHSGCRRHTRIDRGKETIP